MTILTSLGNRPTVQTPSRLESPSLCRSPGAVASMPPLLADASLGHFDAHLQSADNPAADTGLPVGSYFGAIPAVDLEGNPRPVGPGVEMKPTPTSVMPTSGSSSEEGTPGSRQLSPCSHLG